MEMGETLSGGPNQNSIFCLSHLVAWIGNEKEDNGNGVNTFR